MPNTMLTSLDAVQMRAFYAAGHWQSDTIFSSAQAQAAARPDKIAIRDRFRAVTYSQLIEAADRLAADLAASGLRAGSRVAVWLPSRIETAVALLACSRSGFVCCPSLHRDHTVGEIRDLMLRMRASALICETGYGADADRRDIIAESAGVSSLKKIYRLDPLRAETTALFADLPAVEPRPVDENPDTVVYLAFTSGTTGQPKGVMHTDNTLLANARALSHDWSLGAESVIYSMSPLSHNLGFGAAIMTFARGGEFVIHDVPRGGSLVDRIVETGGTFMIGVPTHAIDLLAEVQKRGLTKLGRVMGFRISGASVPPSVAGGLLAHGIVPQSGFGMTEAGSHHYTLPDDDAETICNTSGRACDGYEIRIFDQDNVDLELGPGQNGQIGGRGASLMLGYFDDQEVTESCFNSTGWFMTGDIGWMDEKGYLRVTGRKKDIILRGGHNIYPAKIEALVMQHEGIERAAAIPVPDDRLGEKVCLSVVIRQGLELSWDDILAHLDHLGLSKYDMPEYVLKLDHMPLTPSGKILKRELVSAIADGKLKPEPVRFKSGQSAQA